VLFCIWFSSYESWLKRVRETPRKVMKYKEANWDQIKKDLEKTLTTMNNIYEKSDANILWNTLKNDIINSTESNIPHKLFTYKQRLPSINNNLRKLINKMNKFTFL
jgi:H2-forming N5,N10-methylenetetrahydromethanopterin dehydrogenase-like enzyme